MARLHDAIIATVLHSSPDTGEWTGTARELCEEVRLLNPGLNATVADVDEAIRMLHQERALRLDAPNGYQGPIRLRLSFQGRTSMSHQISVHGGNVQIGDHNRQTITYGNVLQTLSNLIQEDPNTPEEQKREIGSAIQTVLAHPLTQTVLSGAAALAAAVSGGK
jgi:hypothetical protein